MERVRQEEIGGRETMAEAFVGRVSSNPSVREVWLSDSGDEAVVHVVVDGVSLEQELALEAIFTAVLSAHGQAFSGYLHIHTLQEGVPVEARSGWRLFPE